MYYNGFEVHPQILRTRSEGFSAGGDALAEIRALLKEAFDNDAFLGHDTAGDMFRSQTYQPMMESIYDTLAGCAENMHGMKKGLCDMADNYQRADHASDLRD
jgi:hypothetical protein